MITTTNPSTETGEAHSVRTVRMNRSAYVWLSVRATVCG